MPSVVVYMDAPTGSTGQVTRRHPGMAVRMTMTDEILTDGLDVLYEILGGTSTARQQVIQGIQHQFDATFKVTQDRDDTWRAQVCLRDTEAIRSTALFAAMLDAREHSDRLVVVYEDGLMIMRLDLPKQTTTDEAAALAQTLKAAARRTDDNAVVRTGEMSRDLEDWEPLTEFRPTR